MPARCKCCGRRRNFTAVLVGNDQMALGVLSAFHQHQVPIPGEKSVIGYDDTYESSFFYPALTTVSLDLDLQGKEAVRRLLDSGDQRDISYFFYPSGSSGRAPLYRAKNGAG